MTRVLVIGNSHSAAIRIAWNGLAEQFPQIEMRFFVAGGNAFRCFDLDDRGIFRCVTESAVSKDDLQRIRLQNDGLSTDCNWADHVLLIGRNYGEVTVARIARQWDIDGFPGSGSRQRLSRSAFDAFCDYVAKAHLPDRTWGKLTGKVTVAGAPYPSSSLEEASLFLGAARPWKALLEDPAGFAEVSGVYDLFFAGALGQHGLHFAPQPVASRTALGFTRPEYVRVAPDKHMRNGVPVDDFRHMNEAYGRLRLLAYLADFVGATLPS